MKMGFSFGDGREDLKTMAPRNFPFLAGIFEWSEVQRSEPDIRLLCEDEPEAKVQRP
jgi:hypothetical protein